MAKFFPIFSSSSGNSTYIGDGKGGVLVDVGVSYRRIKDALSAKSININSVKAVLITHEHTDLVKGLKTFLKNHKVPVIASRDTVYALEFHGMIDSDTHIVYIDEQKDFCLDGMLINGYPTSHDCIGSSCYTVSLGSGVKTAVCTDLGVMTEEIKNGIKGSDIILIEANHDPVMLRLGPYPPELKLRIASDKGHLPNAACAETAAELYALGTRRFVLGHISEHNNTADKASSAVRAALMDKNAKQDEDYLLYIAKKEDNQVIPI